MSNHGDAALVEDRIGLRPRRTVGAFDDQPRLDVAGFLLADFQLSEALPAPGCRTRRRRTLTTDRLRVLVVDDRSGLTNVLGELVRVQSFRIGDARVCRPSPPATTELRQDFGGERTDVAKALNRDGLAGQVEAAIFWPTR